MKNKEVIINELRKNYESRIYITRLCETFKYYIDYSFYTLKVTKDSDRMKIKVLIVVTCHRLLDRTEIVKKFNDNSNNSVHLTMKASKKVVEILIHKSYPKVDDN